MRTLNWLGLGSMFGGAVGLFVLSTTGAGCSSSDDDAPAATDSGAEASTDATVVILPEASTPQEPCMTCFEMTNAEYRIPDSPGPCADNNVNGTGKSSKQLFDEAFQCACQDFCASQCADSCGSGAARAGACLVCAASNCVASRDACFADLRDSGAAPMDSGTGSGDDASTDDAGITDAGAGGQ